MKKKKLILILAIILFILIYPYKIFATELELNTNSNEIKSGDTITLVVKIKNVNKEDGINLIQGQLIYDKDDWEQILPEDIKCKNNWSITYNSGNTESEGKFILINVGANEEKAQELLEITLRSKNRIISNNTEIKLIDLYTTDGEDMIELNSQVQQIKIHTNIQNYAVLIGLIVVMAVIIIIIITMIIRKRK